MASVETTRGLERWAPVAALALPAALYLATLFPGIGDRWASGDAIELQLVGRVLGVAHEPGYPQYVLLSFLWSWVPLPLTLASKINLLSAVFALAAGALFFSTARGAGSAPTGAILACWALLTAPDLWALATQAEVYTLHLLWVTFFFWSALRWRRTGARRHLLWLLFGYALSFGNHLTMITLLPALVFLLLTRKPRLVTDLSAWKWAAIAVVTGASQYLLLVWRSYFPHPTLLGRFPLRATPAEILAYITGDRFVDKHWLPGGTGEWLGRIGEALADGAGQLTIPFALVALYGAAVSWRRDRLRTFFLLLAAGSAILFAAAYTIRDWKLYCIPAWVVGALFAAQGTSRVMEKLPRAGLVAAVVLGLVLAPRIVRGVDEMRVEANPADLSRVLPALPVDARVIAAGGQRMTRLHEDYYRYAERVAVPPGARFFSARHDVLQRALHLRYRSFFFRSPTIVRIFDGRLIDYHEWPGWRGAGGPVYVTGTLDPLATVELGASPGALELTVRGARRTLTADKDLYLFFAGARDGRAKGLEALDLAAEAGERRLEQLLDTLPAGDIAVLLVPRVSDHGRVAVGEILAAAGGDPPAAATRRLVAAWRKDAVGGMGGMATGPRVWEDPDDGAVWAIALADL